MTRDELKKLVCQTIDAERERIIAIGDRVLRHPETAFREFRTSAMVKEFFHSLNLPVRENLAVTGCRAELCGGKPGPTVALLGEMDAIVLPGHPYADPRTGAAHGCGHHAQVAALLGAALGLTTPGVMPELAGKAVLIAVPAEEHHPGDYYDELLESGKIRLTAGKPEMIIEGVFDDIGLAMMIHSGHAAFTPSGFNGFILKQITFGGRAAHAGLRPDQGINALSMARLALQAIDSQRDTFRDDDAVRIHGIIQDGGNAINVVPARAELALQIRAKTPEALRDAAAKVDRSVHAAALAFGGEAAIRTEPGYLPFKSSPSLEKIHAANLHLLQPETEFFNYGHRASSTDMGDVSMIMPALHAYTGGTAGAPHTVEFVVTDPEQAYVLPAKLLAMNTIELLYGDGAAARQVMSEKPSLTRDEYRQLHQANHQPQQWNYRDPQ